MWTNSEDQSSVAEIRRLKFFVSKVKIWAYAQIRRQEYQNLSLEDRSSLLKS